MKEIKINIENGNLLVRNVPHLHKDGELFADGSEYVLTARTMYSLTFIFSKMVKLGLREYDFDNFNLNESILRKND